MIFVMPYLVTMLVVARALGISWRAYVKGERQLSVPGHLLGAASAICVAGTYVAFMNR